MTIAIQTFLAASFIFAPSGRAQAPVVKEEAQSPNPKCFLWKIQGPTNAVFALGSMWAPDRETMPVDPKMEEAYSNSPLIAVQFTLSEEGIKRIAEKMHEWVEYPPDETVLKHVSKSTYEALRDAFRDSTNRWERKRPWALALDINRLEFKRQGLGGSNSVYTYFTSRAARDKKTVIPLEPPDTWLDTINEMSDVEADQFLARVIYETEYFRTNAMEMFEVWKTGDVAKFDDIKTTLYRYYPEIRQKTIDARNRAWLPDIEKLLAGHTNVLLILPAMNLVGEGGVIHLLESRGFKVNQL